MKTAQTATLALENIVGGGQTIGTLADCLLYTSEMAVKHLYGVGCQANK